MGRFLYLMRHGRAKPGRGTDDFTRPLSTIGIQAVQWQRDRFKEPSGIRPDCILCSTAKRARETADILKGLFIGTPVFYRESLYLAPAFRIIGVLNEMDEVFRRILVIGHHPGLEQTIGLLTRPENRQNLTPGDCAVLYLNSLDWRSLEPGCGRIEKIFSVPF
ncbi:MAG: histidine phosphatase family protein [Alphaproteobacteria bacterium]|nr:histidine phosphatase family protein [Alphaproteobacteria bacterium]